MVLRLRDGAIGERLNAHHRCRRYGNPVTVTIGPTQMHSTRRAMLQNIELMPQYQDFGFQSPSRLEAVAQHADEKEANCNHSAIMC